MIRPDTKPARDESPSDDCPGQVVAILNPKAGSATADAIRRALEACFAGGRARLEIHEIGDGDDLGAVVRERLARGVELVIAAGGDGTVSAVADALAGTGTPLGILPMGTANVLARELEIPLDVEAAARLLVDDHDVVAIDAMRVGSRHYLTQVGVGLDALMIRDTPTEQKKRYGNLAYLWAAARHLVGFQPRRFTLEIDGKTINRSASEVVVANVGTLGQPPFRWGPDIRVDDGTVDVCVARARTIVHYLVLGWHVVTGQHKADPNVRYYQARRAVSIATRRPIPVQADGEVIGETPVRVEVAPGAVRVVAPRRE
ncbi:MAG TPA: diacylglycerol kinase family protein [Isosphaeraceae bacterium]